MKLPQALSGVNYSGNTLRRGYPRGPIIIAGLETAYAEGCALFRAVMATKSLGDPSAASPMDA